MTNSTALDPVGTPRVRTGSTAVRGAVLCLIALVAAALVKATLVETWYAPDNAMAPSVQAGQRVVLAKVGDVGRGDVVVADISDSFSGPSRATHEADGAIGSVLSTLADALGVRNGERSVIGRVVAVGGDTVTCCDGGQVTVGQNDVAPAPAAGEDFVVRVPSGSVWIVGDRPEVALDSLAHVTDAQQGLIPADAVIGRVVARLWPLGGVS